MFREAAWRAVALFALFASVATGQETYEPYTPGPHALIEATVNATAFSPDLPTHLSVWAPAEAGTYPVLYFLDGFGASVPGAGYGEILEHITSYGFVVVLPWKVTLIADPEDKVPAVQKVIEWCRVYLDQLLIDQGADPDFATDFDTSFGMAHSAGAHVFCSYLQEIGCGTFKGVFYLSPVDGADPYGLIDSFCIEVGETLNFDIPTVVLAAGLDGVPGLPSSNTSCAPDDLSNRRFYNACDPASPRWFLNATDFGHADFMDPLFEEVTEASQFCASNHEATQADFLQYRRYVAGTIVSFLFSLIQPDCTVYTPYLQDTGLMPVNVYGEHVNPWESTGECFTGYCSWMPLPTTGAPLPTTGAPLPTTGAPTDMDHLPGSKY